MPNRNNIENPICLVGLGRSGTTLVTNVFRNHPDFQSLGETANLVYSTFYHIEKSLPITGPRNKDRSDTIVARDCVYKTLLDIYASSKPHWFQKPIFTPSVSTVSGMTPQAFGAWYWSTSQVLFPGGKFFTVMRNPADVVESSMIRWNWSFDQAIANMRRSYDLLLHPDTRLGVAYDFDDLVADPEKFVRAVLAFAEVPFHEACLAAFERAHAPNNPKEVDVGIVPENVIDTYNQILARFKGGSRPL